MFAAKMTVCYHKLGAIFLAEKCLIFEEGLARFFLHRIHLPKCSVIYLNSPVAVIRTITVCVCVCACSCVRDCYW